MPSRYLAFSWIVLLTGLLSACSSQYTPIPLSYSSSNYLLSDSTPISTKKTEGKKAPNTFSTSVLSHQNDARLEKDKAVANAMKSSTLYPKSSDFVNGAMVYPLIDGVIYAVYTAPLSLTDLQFEKGESLVSISSGDTSRWQIAKTYSGNGGAKQWHLLIKPEESNLSTSLAVMTDVRTYHVRLLSTESTHMPVVRWDYPDLDATTEVISNPQGAENQTQHRYPNHQVQANYYAKLIQGYQAEWMPESVYNDGVRTYIKFPSTLSTTNLPVLKIALNPHTNNPGNMNFSPMVNYRIKGRYMIVDEVIRSAVLQSGVDPHKDKSDSVVKVWIYQKSHNQTA